MISKKLVKNVINAKYITKLNCSSNTITIYRDGTCIENQCYQYDIYNFAHKCKSWAMLEGYYIKTWFDEITCYCEIYNHKRLVKKFNIQDVEYEAIFKACEWILEEQNNDTK